MAIQMYKGKVSEIVDNRDVKTRLEDGWTFKPSQPKAPVKSIKDRIKAEAEVETKTTDPNGPVDLNQEEQ